MRARARSSRHKSVGGEQDSVIIQKIIRILVKEAELWTKEQETSTIQVAETKPLFKYIVAPDGMKSCFFSMN